MTVIDKAKKEDIISKPFPHLIIKEAIDEAVCDRLLKEFPPLAIITKGAPYDSNQRFSYSAVDILENDKISPLWCDFVKAHLSQEFFDKLTALFDLSHLQGLKVGIRKIGGFHNADILLDAQICVNTPVWEKPSSVRTAHVDDPRKVFAGLFYLRLPQDDSSGGELEIYEYARPSFKFEGQQIAGKYVRLIKRVPYQKNTLVLFANSLDSLHGVSPRLPTPHPRLFFNLVGEIREPLFDLRSHQLNRWRRLAKRFYDKIVA